MYQLKWVLTKDGLKYSRKRKENTRMVLASIISIILALIVALLIATAMGYNPFIIIARLFSIGFDDPTYLFYKIGVYAIAGFSFYFAWKCGIINIGISGQMLLSGTIIVLVTQALGSQVPNGAGQILILILGMIVGSATATFVGLLQTYLRVNSIVSAILLNWIIYFICFYILATYTIDPGAQFVASGEIPINYCFVDQNTNTGGIIPIVIICVVLAIAMFVVFKYTVFGHKIKSIGLSKDASLYAGYNVKGLSLASFAISGAISGILACICYTSSSTHAIPLSTFFDAVPTEGFDGIMISLVGGNNPFGILLSSALFGLFGASSQGLPTDPSFNNVIVGCVLLGSAMSVIVYKWKPWIKLNSFKYDINYVETQTAFDNSIDSLLSKYHSILSSEKNIYKNIKKTKNKEALLNLCKEHNVLVDESLDVNQLLDIYEKARILKITEKYELEKANLIDKFNYQKVVDLINSRLLTKQIIDKKISLINNKYDERLTKYINKIKQKDLSLQTNKVNADIYQKKHLKYENLKKQAIEKNNNWKQRAIDRMIKYQNRYLVDKQHINHEFIKIDKASKKINSNEYKNELNNLISQAQIHLGIGGYNG